MSEDEIKELIKKEILDNMCVSVDISAEPYSDNEYFNVRVVIEYDGEELTGYGDTIRISPNKQ